MNLGIIAVSVLVGLIFIVVLLTVFTDRDY
jgi:hypothetical protein